MNSTSLPRALESPSKKNKIYELRYECKNYSAIRLLPFGFHNDRREPDSKPYTFLLI